LQQASVEAGFELPEIDLVVLSESEFYGRTAGYDSRQVKKLASRRKNVVDPLQLKTSDFVVHQTHGIDKFLELTQRKVSSGGRNAVKTTRESLVIEYVPNKRGYPNDKLYVPTDQLDLLTRYVGAEAPALSKMDCSQGQGAQGGARHRRRAGEALLGANAAERARFSPGTPCGVSSRRRSRSRRPLTSSPRSTR